MLFVAHPPVGAWPLAFLAPGLLLAAIAIEDGAARRPRTFRLGLLAGAVGYLPMLAWLINPAGYLAWTLLGLSQAAFLGGFAWLVRPFVQHPVVAVVAPVAWVGLDAWRGRFPLDGFEWGALAYAHAEGSWMLPIARIAGAHALTFATVLLAALGYVAVRQVVTLGGDTGTMTARLQRGLPRAQRSFVALAGVLLLTSVATIEPPGETGETLDVLAVQGLDTATDAIGGRAEDRAVAANLTQLTRDAVAAGGAPDLTVWPESSLDRDPFTQRGSDLLPYLRAGARNVDGNLLAGAVLDGPVPDETRWTSSIQVDAEGTVVDRYDKRHPVPFGEFVPMRDALDWFPPLRQIPRDTLAGDGPHSFLVDGHRVAAAICFETLFGELVRTNVLAAPQDAGLVVATTTDASYGFSSEPAQHLAQSQLRAVETGRWVVHAAQSGSSAFIDPHGKLYDQTALFETTTLRRDVPIVAGRTPYLVVGDIVGDVARWAVLAGLLLLAAARVRARLAVRRLGREAR